MKLSGRYIFIVMLLMLAAGSLHAAGKPVFSLEVYVHDGKDHAVAAAVVLLEPQGIWSMTGDDGKAVLKDIKIPVPSETRVSVSILGYKTWTGTLIPESEKENHLEIDLEKESFAMDEVVVVAENKKSGESTASKIGRMAIDHLQATNLSDLLQLVPGQISMSNPSLTRSSHFNMRTLYDNQGSSSILMDGVPISGNAEFNGNAGVDLRSIGTDNIQSVEIIRGIASAEYGDVSSGTMLVNSKVGITDLNLRGKIMPGIMQFYAGKGFKAGKAGYFNISADYAHGKSDPRYKTDTYDRIIADAAHNIQVLDGCWDLTTKLNLTATEDWSGADPSAPETLKKYYDRNVTWSIRVNHQGRVNLNRMFAKTLKYDISFQNNSIQRYSEDLHDNVSGTVFTSTGEGLFHGQAVPRSYETVTGVDSNPIMVFAKLSDNFDLDKGKFRNRILLGAEYRAEGNEGIGNYEKGGIPSISQDRMRRYRDIPWMHQLSIYAEDRFNIPLSRNEYPNIKGQIGVRWTMIQPGADEFMNSWSPRINLSFNVADWASIRGGYGQSEKLPSLQQLYPDKIYFDWFSLSSSNSAGVPYFMYTTRIEDGRNIFLKPMKNNKFEIGFDFKPHNGMSFSVVGYWETTRNAFETDKSIWKAYQVPVWEGNDISFQDGNLIFDKEHPSRLKTVLANIPRPGNSGWQRNCGIEYDFDFGKISATNTSFYLNGSYTSSSVNSTNCSYEIPSGQTVADNNVYLVFPEGTGSKSERRRFSTALRVVQHIPVIRFVVSATAQFVFYDYNKRAAYGEVPTGYITDDRSQTDWVNGRKDVRYVAFTPEQYADPDHTFEGFKLKDQIVEKQMVNLPAIWPPVWTLNLRVTKEVGDFMGFSFYVNNMLFHQPWQKISNSTNLIERNGSLFSYGLELFLHF